MTNFATLIRPEPGLERLLAAGTVCVAVCAVQVAVLYAFFPDLNVASLGFTTFGGGMFAGLLALLTYENYPR